MRAVLLVLIVAVVAVLVAIATGFLNINRVGGAAPEISATNQGIVAKGGEAPAFDVATGSVKVGSDEKTVRVPTIQVQPPANEAAATPNNAM